MVGGADEPEKSCIVESFSFSPLGEIESGGCGLFLRTSGAPPEAGFSDSVQ